MCGTTRENQAKLVKECGMARKKIDRLSYLHIITGPVGGQMSGNVKYSKENESVMRNNTELGTEVESRLGHKWKAKTHYCV